jgi:hypothetical protein
MILYYSAFSLNLTAYHGTNHLSNDKDLLVNCYLPLSFFFSLGSDVINTGVTKLPIHLIAALLGLGLLTIALLRNRRKKEVRIPFLPIDLNNGIVIYALYDKLDYSG